MKKLQLKSGLWPQWIATAEICLMGLVAGIETGWTSPALAILLGPESPIPMDKADGAWIASLLNIGRAAGGLVGAIDVELFGSKTAVFHIGLVQAVSIIFLGIANSVSWLYASRLMAGLASGLFFIAFPLYMGEISSPKIRGLLISLVANSLCIGYVVGNITGAYMSIPTFSIMLLALTIVFIVTFYFLPNTSHFLVMKDRSDEAQDSIRWYDRDADVAGELLALGKFVKDKQAMTFKHLINEFILPHNRIALFKVIMVYILMQLSGLYTVGFYMQIILTNAKVDIIDPEVAVIIVSTIGLVGGCVALLMIDRYGRKPVLANTAFGLAVSLCCIGAHFQLLEIGADPKLLQWFMILTIVAMEFFINLGIIPIPSALLSEIFAPNIKSYCSCLANVTSGLVAFMVTRTYQTLIDSIDYGTYYIYATTMVLLGLFTITQLPETKGKSLQEIQIMLMTK